MTNVHNFLGDESDADAAMACTTLNILETVSFNWTKCMVCELCLNKVIK